MSIKIITGWDKSGGSSTAHINLTNEFNKYGIDCTLYGRDDSYFSKYCKADKIENIKLNKEDCLIVHFYNVNWTSRPPIKKFVYSCHEKHILPIKNINYKLYDFIHYVGRPQMEWHDVDYEHCIIPNILDDLKPSTCTDNKISAILGNIDENKQVHVSIQRAIDDGMEKVLIFGSISDHQYYNNTVKPLIDGSRIIYMGHCDDKQKIYNQTSHVYHSSLSETFGLVQKECELTGVQYHGNNATEGNFEIEMSNDEIIEAWKKELKI